MVRLLRVIGRRIPEIKNLFDRVNRTDDLKVTLWFKVFSSSVFNKIRPSTST